jgi:O-antigen/teichoic acid export membrane protein
VTFEVSQKIFTLLSNLKITSTMSNQNSHTTTIVSMARGAGIVFFGIFLSRILGYILRIVLKRVLGLEDFGLLWSTFNVIEMVTFFCLLGIPNALARYIAFYRAQSKIGRVGGFIVVGFFYILPIVFLAIFLVHSQSTYFASLFGKPDIEPLLRTLSFGILPLTLLFIFGGMFRGFKMMPQMVFTQQLSRNVFMFFCFGLFFLFGFGGDSASLAMLFGLLIAALVAVVQFFIVVDKNVFKQIELNGVFSELLHYSWPLVFTTLFWNMSGRIDVFFLTIYETETNIGVYNAILPLAQFVPVVMQSFISILMPIFAGIFANYEKNALHTMHQAATKWIIAFTVPLFFLLAIFAEPILHVLLGSDTVIGAVPLTIAGLGYFINAAFGVLNILLNASGKTKLTLLNTSTYIVLNIVLDILLIPRFGLAGAATAGALSMLALNIMAMIENYRLFEITPLNKQMFYLIGVGLLVSAITFLFKVMFPIDIKIVTIAAGSLVFISLYFIGLKKIKIFDENDLAIITAVENKIGKKLTLLRRIID